MSNWGGKREGSGRKALSTKDVKVRLTSEQHKTLKALGGSEWLQNQIDSNKSFAGRRLVIEECGAYICDSFKDAVSLIADQIECETVRDEPDTDKIETLNNVLKEISNLM